MCLQLEDQVPNIMATTTLGGVEFYTWLNNSWCIFFSHPADFTPVCTTELGEVAQLKNEFERRHVKVIALSVDSLENHFSWITDIEELYSCPVYFPIIADEDFKIAKLFGFVHANASQNFTVRSVVIIGPDKKIKMTLTYPAATGRNFGELLRVLDSLQMNKTFGLLTPANWQLGEPVIVSPSIKTEDISPELNQNLEIIKPYFRKVKMPD